MTFYNDNDQFCCDWLERLIEAGHLPAGRVDRSDIRELDAINCDGDCHFFAGIGGWPLALCLAEWPTDRRVWSASCPCQPLSCAGQRKGHADKRHLWPAFYALVDKRRPATIFGEQVARKDGREWLAGIRTDLEGIGYAVGGANLPAASSGAPHPRQRIYWVALAGQQQTRRRLQESEKGNGENHKRTSNQFGRPSGFSGLVQSNGSGRNARKQISQTVGYWSTTVATSVWSEFDICHFTGPDAGKTRRIEPGSFPLAHGIPARVGRLRAYGNAIVPQLAAEFIKAVMDIFDNEPTPRKEP